MKFFCNPKQLMNSLSIVQKAVSSKTTLPILKGIYLEARDNNLKLVGTDMEIGINHVMEANIIEEGSIVVDSRLFSDIIRRLPEAGIETGVNPDGTPNKINKFIRILCEEIVKEIKDNAKVTCAIAPTSINSIGTGANAGGTIVVKSYNTIPVNTDGLVQ